jgi:hypothetical protein
MLLTPENDDAAIVVPIELAADVRPLPLQFQPQYLK